MKHRNPALAPGFLLPGKTFVREIAVGLYERWAARRLGVCELPEEQSGDRGPH